MLGSLLAIANKTLAHFKSFRVANIASSLTYFSVWMGVRINDNDFGADLITLNHSNAATSEDCIVNNPAILHG